MDGSVSLFDLLLYDKYFIHIISRVFVQYFFPFFTKSDDCKGSVFRVDKPASSRYQYSALSVEYRFDSTAHNG